MTKKERVCRAIAYERVDRIPLADSFWEDTLSLWKEEGYPEGSPPFKYFDFDIVSLSVDASPGIEPELLAEEEFEGETYRTFRDRMGYVARKIKGKSRTLEFVSYPAGTREQWNSLKERFHIRPGEPSRFDTEIFPFRLDRAPAWEQVRESVSGIDSQGYYILAGTYGPHEAVWRFHGFEQTLYDLALNPDLIKDMAHTYTGHLISVLNRGIDEGIPFDGFFMIDDLAAVNGMLFSPAMWRDIYKPEVQQIGAFLRNNGKHFWMHCCGNAEEVFEDLIECGLQVINPLEVKSGLDVRNLKGKYGGRLAFYGNIDVRNMANTDFSAIREEIESKLSLFTGGGYIYHSDHSIPPEVSFPRYNAIIDTVKNLTFS